MSMTMEQVVTQLQQELFTLRAQLAAEYGLADAVRAINILATAHVREDTLSLIDVCSSTMKRPTSSRSVLSWFRVSCHVANGESSQERGVLKLVVARNALLHWNPACFGFLQNVKMTRLVMNVDKVFVRAGLFEETSPFFCQL